MIVCLEDDENILNLITYTLKASSFESIGFKNVFDFYSYIENNEVQLIILDIMLPYEDGLTVLQKLKSSSKYKNIPVILATAKGTEYDKVIGLNYGADDYLVKPFGMMELVARVKAVLRRVNYNDTKSIIKNKDLVVDIDKHIVTLHSKELPLTLKEYDILVLLITNIDSVFTRDELLERIWGTSFIGESRTIDVHIGTLRNKLLDYGRCILTLRGVGYKMVKFDEEENI